MFRTCFHLQGAKNLHLVKAAGILEMPQFGIDITGMDIFSQLFGKKTANTIFVPQVQNVLKVPMLLF